MICPSCGKTDRVHRSHSRGFLEQTVKTLTPYQLYRCHDCNWRGWLLPTRERGGAVAQSYKSVAIVFAIGLLVGVLVSLWLLHHD